MDRMKKTILACLIAALAIPSMAAGEGLRLREIMFGLADDMAAIVRAITLEDYETVRIRALRIAEHERPPFDERMRILKFLNDDAAGFKAADGVVHSSAKKLSDAAAKKDYYEVVENFRDVLNGCVDCHTKYKSKVRKHFYTDTGE
jgi:cytochrome c556